MDTKLRRLSIPIPTPALHNPPQQKAQRRQSAPAIPTARHLHLPSTTFTRNTRFLTATNLSHLESLGLPDITHPILSPLVPKSLRFLAAQNVIRDFLAFDHLSAAVPPPPPTHHLPRPPAAPRFGTALCRQGGVSEARRHREREWHRGNQLRELKVALTPTSFTMTDSEGEEEQGPCSDSLSDVADEIVDDVPDFNLVTPLTLDQFESLPDSPAFQTRLRHFRTLSPPRPSHHQRERDVEPQQPFPHIQKPASHHPIPNARPLSLNLSDLPMDALTSSSSLASHVPHPPSHSSSLPHSTAFTSPMSILPTFPSTSSRSITAHSFLRGHTHPAREEEFPTEKSHRRRDSHHAFVHSLEEPILREPSYVKCRYPGRETLPLPQSPPLQVRKTKSVFYRRISQAREASVGIVACARKLPRAASLSRFKFSLERDRTNDYSPSHTVSPNQFQETPHDHDQDPQHSYLPPSEPSTATNVRSAVPIQPRIPLPTIPDTPSHPSPHSLPIPDDDTQSPPPSVPSLPDLVTIRRVIRRVKKDGTHQLISTRVRVRPEAVLPNGDVVVKRVMKREKEDGTGMETLTVCQVIPRKTPPRHPQPPVVQISPTLPSPDSEKLPSVSERSVSLPSTLLEGPATHRSHSFSEEFMRRRRTSVRLPGRVAQVPVEEIPRESVAANQKMARRTLRKEPSIRRVKSAKMRRTFSGHGNGNGKREEETAPSKSHSPRKGFWSRGGRSAEKGGGRKGGIQRVLSFGSAGGVDDREEDDGASSPIRRLRGVLRAWRGEAV